MSEEVILQYLKSIDERTQRIETNQNNHQERDDLIHGKFEERMQKLEVYQGKQRAVLATVAAFVSGFVSIGAWLFDHIHKGG